MKKHFTDEKTGISYTFRGDYYFPDLALPEEKETRHIGILGDRHRRFLENHQPLVYWELLVNGKLRTYLADIDEQASERIELLVNQMVKAEGVTEQLKAESQMEWVGRINNIRDRAMEIVNRESTCNSAIFVV